MLARARTPHPRAEEVAVQGAPPPLTHDEVARRMAERAARRLQGMDDEAVRAYLAEAVYLERRRFATSKPSELTEGDRAEQKVIERAARAVHRDRPAQERAVLDLAEHYAREVHNPFSPRTYDFATRVLPGALTRLLTATRPRELLGRGPDPSDRIQVQGPTELLAKLARTHTLVLAPTHVSNLDSPLIGYALYASGLPPVIYGAGLNLFSNPFMAPFMSRLGAYTVDRRKKHRVYKDVLKDYSTDAIGRGAHSLFFPGGTRSRSGRIERRVKKGLLGTAILAWQEGLAEARPRPEILVVPCTLSFALVLEAETLIEDSLAEEGRSRYIITDDEFSEARTVASFASRVLNLDASVVVRFGRPLDLVGNPVDDEGRSLGPDGEPIDRRRYVTDRDGRVEWDAQRDRVYTAVLSEALVRAWHRDNVVLATHAAGLAAWSLLRVRHPDIDPYQLVFAGTDERTVPRADLLRAVEATVVAIERLAAAGALHDGLPAGPSPAARAEAVLAQALDRFSRFHKRRALEPAPGGAIRVEPRLALYYGNRLDGYEVDEAPLEAHLRGVLRRAIREAGA